MIFFTKKVESDLNRSTKSTTKKIVDKNSEENKIVKKMNSLLSRKDIINLDNEKVDALRMLLFHFENNKEMSMIRLVKFLKL